MSTPEAAEQVANYIYGLPEFKWQKCPFPYHHMGASIVDASLQAGLKYDSVVLPRVNRLRCLFRNCKTTSAFAALLKKTCLEELIQWTYEEKLNRVKAALRLFLDERVETERDLFKWIRIKANETKLKKCRGVGPKTLDYYKLLSGHPTLAIDRHLLAFLKRAGVVARDYLTAHDILHACAKIMKKPAGDLDHSIWKYMSDKSRTNQIQGGCNR